MQKYFPYSINDSHKSKYKYTTTTGTIFYLNRKKIKF